MARKFKKEVGAIVHNSGVSFRVWAPFADQVWVSGSFNDWGKHELAKENDGYWWALVKEAEAGQEYKFVIQNGGNTYYRNDPRALHFTTTAGNSVIVDMKFDWEDSHFVMPKVEDQVIYELHVGTFNRSDPSITGTFQEALEKLDYLAELGVNIIELMPVCSMPMDRGWGYAIDYIYAVESLYGGHYAFMEFVKAAHQRGIGVILDVVYNHLGPDNNMDLWQFDGWSQDGMGGIYFYNDWRAKTPWGDTRPDYGRQEVRQYLLDNVRMWLTDFRLDGLRVDSTIFIRNVEGHNDDPDKDIADGWSLLQDINELAKKINPGCLTIAEDVGVNDYLTKPKAEGGAGFDTQWSIHYPGSLRSILDVINDTDRNLDGLCENIYRYFNGRSFQKVIYSDSHDSAANGNSRLIEEISPGNPSSVFARKRALLASSVVLTAPGIPMLLQGQEFMQGGNFNDWDALDWEKSEQFKGIVEAHKHLIALRKNQHGNTGGLSGQSVKIIHRDNDNKVLAYHRWNFGGPGDDVMVVINFANKKHQTYELPFPGNGTWKVRFSSAWSGYSPDFKDIAVPDIDAQNNSGIMVLPPYCAVILSQDV